MNDIEKIYNPTLIESHWYAQWEKNNYFIPQSTGSPYCIMLPPPNITGSLHMGHGFQHTLMDALIRYHRMKGDNTLWQPGTDHASIAAQMVVERQLEAQGKSRHDLGREAFVEKVWEWKKESGGMISQQMRRMGSSTDWSRERFTMDPKFSFAVEETFIRLYEEGLIYRGKRLVNWDPKMRTAVSDLEVVFSEEKGSLWHLRYPLADKSGFMVVATTRPETMLGDTAVAVHPDDERYKHLIGKKIMLPLTNREIPIIGDDYVDPAFGSGCVKITPAHDFNDYAMGHRHDLPMITIFTTDIRINENAPAHYQGMDRFAARKKIIEDLKTLDLIEKIEDYVLNVPRGEKSGEILEPYLTDQWFVKIKPLAAPAIEAVETGKIKFVPENWTKTYFQWMHHIEDWCISRQLWWGHRLPVWYDEAGKIYVGHSEKDIRSKYALNAAATLTQETDVLDTWFSAALWPFATLGWPEKTPELKTFYPTSVLVTGFDIIFFWVARMIMFGIKFMDDVPFKEVYITGLIRDAEGHKMSKTKGNVLDPIDLIDGIDLESLIKKRTHGLIQPAMTKKIEQATRKQFPQGIPAFGTDALRFTYCALATPGRDIRFDLGRVEGYRNFCNKLWNAARYVLITLEKAPTASTNEMNASDRWIRSKLQETIRQAHQHFNEYRFDLLAQSLYEFTWYEFCDWYLEFSKHTPTTYTHETLKYVLETLLRLLHPLMPFITEEIWQRVAQGETIMLQPYPHFDEKQIDTKATEEMEWLKKVITGIRTLRSENNIAPSKKVRVLLFSEDKLNRTLIERNEHFLKNLARIDSVEWIDSQGSIPESYLVSIGTLEVRIPHEGLMDKKAEVERINKEIEKFKKEKERTLEKLNNPNFERAPDEVRAKEKRRLDETMMEIQKLEAQLKQLEKPQSHAAST